MIIDFNKQNIKKAILNLKTIWQFWVTIIHLHSIVQVRPPPPHCIWSSIPVLYSDESFCYRPLSKHCLVLCTFNLMIIVIIISIIIWLTNHNFCYQGLKKFILLFLFKKSQLILIQLPSMTNVINIIRIKMYEFLRIFSKDKF
jgi:hypothetical protein